MNSKMIFFKILLMNIAFIPNSNLLLIAQENFLLGEKDMQEYKLIRQLYTLWPTGSDSYNSNVIEQKWKISERNEYYIHYCRFESEEDAIKGTAYAANSCSMPFIFGSPTGEIIGNSSWVAVDGRAIYFQQRNFGIKIYKPINLQPEDCNTLVTISNKIVLRISENVQSNNNISEELLKYQLSIENCKKIIKQSDTILSQYGYIEFKVENSKWLLSEDSSVIGIRKQWVKEQSIICIDITEYSNDLDAQKALEFRSKIYRIPISNLDDYESISSAISEWRDKYGKRNTLNFISINGRSEETSLHFYCYDKDGIDTDKIYYIIKNIISVH